jgi:hypothetical protein
MNLDALFGSKTKLDILQFLVFRRQGISMRAFDHELEFSFPAIKKQIDQMEEGGILDVQKDTGTYAISLNPGLYTHLKALFLFSLKNDLKSYFSSQDFLIKKYFRGRLFGNEFEQDLVLIYTLGFEEHTDQIKRDLNDLFRSFMIIHVNVVFMSESDFDKRYRMADKFVLSLMRQAEADPK